MKKEVKDFTRWVVFIVCIGMWVLGRGRKRRIGDRDAAEGAKHGRTGAIWREDASYLVFWIELKGE